MLVRECRIGDQLNPPVLQKYLDVLARERIELALPRVSPVLVATFGIVEPRVTHQFADSICGQMLQDLDEVFLGQIATKEKSNEAIRSPRCAARSRHSLSAA